MLFSRKKQVPPPAVIESTKTIPPADPVVGSMSFQLANLQGLGTREAQEDSFAFGNALDPEAIAKGGLLLVVADGMGGMRSGKAASDTAVASVLQAFPEFDLQGDVPGQLNKALLAANDAVYEKLEQSGGTTMVLALIHEENLWFASVGDSYLFLLRNRQLTRLNRSQNIFSELCMESVRAGELSPAAALQDPEKHAITQFVGMEALEEIDYLRRPLQLQAGDVLLACSDGVGGTLSDECIEKCLSHGSPEDMCKALNSEIRTLNLRFQDNYTALVVQCRKE